MVAKRQAGFLLFRDRYCATPSGSRGVVLTDCPESNDGQHLRESSEFAAIFVNGVSSRREGY
jgi:hypothetical protein